MIALCFSHWDEDYLIKHMTFSLIQQVIQHAIHRPQSMAAQYLHQMYAAQQQHLMLQTAALQQHQHTPHLQSLATIQQVTVFSLCVRGPCMMSHFT